MATKKQNDDNPALKTNLPLNDGRDLRKGDRIPASLINERTTDDKPAAVKKPAVKKPAVKGDSK